MVATPFLPGINVIECGGDSDLWITPTSASDPILPILQERIGGRQFEIIDPGCATGNLSLAARKLDPQPSFTVGIEIDDGLVAQAYSRLGNTNTTVWAGDFTSETFREMTFVGLLPVFLGNPPYSKPRETIGLEFMEHCIELAVPQGGIVCLLLPLDYAHGADRCDSVHANHRSGLYPLRTRPKCGNNKAGARPLAWFLFDLGNPYSEWRPIG